MVQYVDLAREMENDDDFGLKAKELCFLGNR
jgi:hypothetical protein